MAVDGSLAPHSTAVRQVGPAVQLLWPSLPSEPHQAADQSSHAGD